jgi:hypothetical protein
MENMESVVKVLYIYGPFALLILFIFVIERQARAALTSQQVPKRISVAVYAVNWCVIFALAAFALRVWYVLNITPESVIQGTFENLKENETVYTDSENLYLLRLYHGKNAFGYRWRLVAPKQLGEGTRQTIYLSLGQSDTSPTYRYELMIHSAFYSSPVRIVYERNVSRLQIESGGKQEELVPREDISQNDGKPQPRFLRTVHAQSRPSMEAVVQRLESDDPIIRRDARRDLASLGPSAAPWIENILQDSKSSHRLKIAALTALNGIANAVVSPRTRAAIVEASNDKDDPALSTEATRYLYKLPVPGCGVSCGTERWIVKSLSDEDAAKVNLSAQTATVRDLVELKPPSVLPPSGRVPPVELQTYKVEAVLLRYLLEKDHDFHLVIADPTDATKTMIAEIPDPICSRVCESRQVQQIRSARDTFVRNFWETDQSHHKLATPVSVVITGVGFFDLKHGQMGQAPNGIELHPVLDITFR